MPGASRTRSCWVGDFPTFIRDGTCGGRECAGACIERPISRCILRTALAEDEEVGRFMVRKDTSIKWDAGGLGEAGSVCWGGSIGVEVERKAFRMWSSFFVRRGL
jgi:hypothetical protein